VKQRNVSICFTVRPRHARPRQTMKTGAFHEPLGSADFSPQQRPLAWGRPCGLKPGPVPGSPG